MISAFVREQRRYSQKELCGLLECNKTNITSLIRRLKEFGILKAVKATEIQKNMDELLDEDVVVADAEMDRDRYYYVFIYVGVVIVANRVIKCYPKYIRSSNQPLYEMKQILKVLEKYNSKEQIINIFNRNSQNESFNLLAVLLHLLRDYHDNGSYNNTQNVIEINGSGEILWDNTINDTFAYISRNRPYYMELRTRKRVNDEYDYFKRLHECVITTASKELKNAGLLDLFDELEADLTDEVLDDFGDKDYILYRIENELNVQFNTRKQLILKTIYTYIDQSGTLEESDAFSLFGTPSFNIAWEKICADIMDNQLESPLGLLKLPVHLKEGYDREKKLIELIEKPLWTYTEKTAKDTLIPDLITIAKVNEENQFIIFDAKYYNAHLEKGVVPSGQPGIESVTKQYLYQLAYKNFIEDHKFDRVKNCFLLPTENAEIEARGDVHMDMLSDLGLQDINVRLIPAKVAYELYLSGRKMDIRKLNL